MNKSRNHARSLSALFVAVVVLTAEAHTAEPKPAAASESSGYFAGGQVLIGNSSHQDTAWMDTPAECRKFRIEQNILPALERMRQEPDYTFCMEGTLHLMEFLAAHPEMREEIAQRMKEGRFEWGATYNQPYESWFSGEELVRETYYGRRWLRKNFPGCEAKVAFNPDPPARALQMQQILAKAGIPYLFISRYHEGLYRWHSPDGSSVLAYTPGQYGNHARMLNADPEQCVQRIQVKLSEQAPYYEQRGIPSVYLLINSFDFSKPIDFSPLISLWNTQPSAAPGTPPPSMQYSSIRGFFEAIDRAGAQFDTRLGERPDVWAYITGPTHHRTDAVRREGARLLPAAETFTTMACLLQGDFRNWPGREFAQAWMDQIYIDHGIGGKNGHITDEVFHRKVASARGAGRNLLDRALMAIAAQVKTDPTRGSPVVVFNTLSWVRSDVVTVEAPTGSALLRIVDADGREVPSQLTSLGEPEEINVAAAAQGAKAVASSVFDPEHGAERAIDGGWAVRDFDPELGAPDEWKSAAGAGPHWMMVDFGQPRTIHKIVIRNEGVIGAFGAENKFNTADLQLQGSDDAAGPWTDLVPPVTNNSVALTVHKFAPKTVRCVRLLILKAAQSGREEPARIFELQAFAKAPAKARKLVFVAADVPSLGYKTFYLTASTATRSPTPTVVATADGCANQFYRLDLAPGGIKAIFDKQQGRDLLDTEKLLGGEVFTMLSVAADNRNRGTDAGEFGTMPLPVMDETFDRVARHRPPWEVLENGSVRTVYQLEQPFADATVRQRVVVWHALKRIDCEADLAEFSGRFWREFRLALPLALESPQLAYEVPMGVVEIGKDEIPTTGGYAYGPPSSPRTLVYSEQCRDIHPRQMQDFVDASDTRGGLTMSSSVSVFDWIDPTAKNPSQKPLLQPVLLASRKSCNGKGVWYPQTGNHGYRFSLTSHEGGWREGRKPGIAANHPLIPVFAAQVAGATLPAAKSFAGVTAGNAIVSTIKKCEDDDSVVVRLYEIEGKNSRGTIDLFKPITAAEKTNLIEEEGRPLPVAEGKVSIEIGKHSIETVKLALSAQSQHIMKR
ncbi:MAG: glycosyl hydrolase-related protein [Opitutaceae bacterium]|jgi:hypothetical protein